MVEVESTADSSSPGLASHLGFPPECWRGLVESVLLRPDTYVALVDTDWRVKHANLGFVKHLSPSEVTGVSFFATLADDSATALRHLLEDDGLAGRTLELHHRAKAGIRTVEYNFREVEGGWLAVGHDRTVQFELVSQMAVLVEDLEEKVLREKALGDELRALVVRDPLTGLANRRHLAKVLKGLADRFVTGGTGFSVLCLDVDHFKSVNDTHGHVIGDEVLRRVAKVLSNSIRGGDCAARYGGEEFVVVVDAVDVATCRAVGERIRQAVENARMPEPLERVTISVGVAWTRPGRTDMAGKVLDLADQALYRAKASGRNCVRVMDE